MKSVVVETAHRVAYALIPSHRTVPSLVGALPPWRDEEHLAIAEFARISFREIAYRRFIAGVSCPHAEHSFREFAAYLLLNMSFTGPRSLSLADTVLGALCIFSLRMSRCRVTSEDDMRRSLVIALSLSNKISEDVPYLPYDWVKWSNIPAVELMAAEISWLQDLNWMILSFTQGQNYQSWAAAAAIWRIVQTPCFRPLYSSTCWKVICTCILGPYYLRCPYHFQEGHNALFVPLTGQSIY
jgi:hypothetical protein